MVGGSIPSSPIRTVLADYGSLIARLAGTTKAMNRPDVQPDFVLVHGAYCDETSWAKVVPLLTASGAKVTTLTLPAHSDADNELAGQTTLAQYVEKVRQAVATAQKPVVLAGHSMAGMVITGVAEVIPEKIAALAYVCAVLPENGRSVMSYAVADTESRFAAHARPDAELGVVTMTREGLIDTVYSRASEADAAAATATVRAEPLQPFVTEARTTDAGFGSVRRFYFTTTHDRALTPHLQRSMFEAQPCEDIYTLDADHAPMLCAPQALADALLDVRTKSLIAV